MKERSAKAVKSGGQGKSRLPVPLVQPSLARPPEAPKPTELEGGELALYRQALERTRADLQSFAYSVSHDLRAPLRAIQGFSRILLEDFSAQLDPEAQEFLRHIIQNTQHLATQMDDLLRFSRAGKTPPHREEINTSELLVDLIRQLRPELPKNLDIQVGHLPMVFADPNLLRQVFAEFLQNAAKSTATIAEPKIEISGRSDEHAASISFRDNGLGFDPGNTGKLFQVFQKLHSAAEFPGNGVGLAMVRRIVEAHGGCVEAEADVGVGALFSISLPHAHVRALDCVPKSNGRNAALKISA